MHNHDTTKPDWQKKIISLGNWQTEWYDARFRLLKKSKEKREDACEVLKRNILPYPKEMIDEYKQKDTSPNGLWRHCISCNETHIKYKSLSLVDFVVYFYDNVYIDTRELCERLSNALGNPKKELVMTAKRILYCPSCGEMLYIINNDSVLDSYSIFKITDEMAAEGIPF